MVRNILQLSSDRTMEYQLFFPEGYDPSVATPFVISISGMEQKHVNGFSSRLASNRWVLAVPLRSEGAPLFFRGSGEPGDGTWYLQQFSMHLLQNYSVKGGRFLMVGVSNGGSSVLRFATLWPELCCGLVVVTGSLQGLVPQSEFSGALQRLNGLPIDMYVGSKDECGFYPPMVELEKGLEAVGHTPFSELTIYPGVGHVCSPHIDEHMIHGKILIMLAQSWPAGELLRIDAHTAPNAADLLKQLQIFCKGLGLANESRPDGALLVKTAGAPLERVCPKAEEIETMNIFQRMKQIGREMLYNVSAQSPGVEVSDAYVEGDSVEVWSNSLQAWFPGSVQQLAGSVAIVHFLGRSGETLTKQLPVNHEHLRRRTLAQQNLCSAEQGGTMVDAADDQQQQFETRQSFDLGRGRRMEYELFVPSGYDPRVPTPFIISVSGVEQTHVNGFSHRLPSDKWVVAVPLRPAASPLFFEGCGKDGDGIWYLRKFCSHLIKKFTVKGGQFIMAGVSNGGSSVLRLATLFPELCCGLVVVTGSIQGLVPQADLPAVCQRLNGIPIDMYVGTNDECGFYPPMVDLEKRLAAVSHQPLAELTVFRGAGHVCSPLIDEHLIRGKILLMMARSSAGQQVRIDAHAAPNAADIKHQLRIFGEALGLSCSTSTDGTLVACSSSAKSDRSSAERLAPNPRVPVQVERIDFNSTEQATPRGVVQIAFTPRKVPRQRQRTPSPHARGAQPRDQTPTPEKARQAKVSRARSQTPTRGYSPAPVQCREDFAFKACNVQFAQQGYLPPRPNGRRVATPAFQRA